MGKLYSRETNMKLFMVKYDKKMWICEVFGFFRKIFVFSKNSIFFFDFSKNRKSEKLPSIMVTYTLHIPTKQFNLSLCTVSASLRRLRLIKNQGFGVVAYWNVIEIFPIFVLKKPQKVDFWAKKWRFIWILFEFSSSGGLIKSGVL